MGRFMIDQVDSTLGGTATTLPRLSGAPVAPAQHYAQCPAGGITGAVYRGDGHCVASPEGELVPPVAAAAAVAAAGTPCIINGSSCVSAAARSGGAKLSRGCPPPSGLLLEGPPSRDPGLHVVRGCGTCSGVAGGRPSMCELSSASLPSSLGSSAAGAAGLLALRLCGVEGGRGRGEVTTVRDALIVCTGRCTCCTGGCDTPHTGTTQTISYQFVAYYYPFYCCIHILKAAAFIHALHCKHQPKQLLRTLWVFK